MAERNIFLIFNKPQVRRSVLNQFETDFQHEMDNTMAILEDAWLDFTTNRHLGREERMRRIVATFTNNVLSWQNLASRTQETIGTGNPITYQPIEEQFHLRPGVEITRRQLQLMETEMFDLMEIIRETLCHASTRVVDDNDNGEN